MATTTTRQLTIQHVTIISERSFADVREALECRLPMLDGTLIEALRQGDKVRAKAYGDQGPSISIFGARDHGALLEIAGQKRQALQYEIGNPLTASRMTRHQLSAALYAPLRVLLRDDAMGHGVFEYDLPSSLFGQFGDERVTAIGAMLDRYLEDALSGAAA